jgi:3-methyl-2-oxobutanoate hydroxymethyltransferase
MLGANPDFKPKFVRHYANMFEMVSNAVKSYSADVKNQNFPNEEESY